MNEDSVLMLPKVAFSKAVIASATGASNKLVEEALNRANRIRTDQQKKERLDRQECKACFYFPRIAGQACSTRDCSCCDTPVMYGNTSGGVFCLDCAKKLDLCHQCGGDIEMRTNRRKWPGE